MYNIQFHELGKDRMFKIWHAADQAMFIYMCSEGGSIVCSEKAYPIKKGVLCFIGAGKFHYTMPDDPSAYDRSKLFVSSDMLQHVAAIMPYKDILRKFSDDSFVYAQIPCDKTNEVETIFKEINDYKNDDVYGPLITAASIIKLLVFSDKFHLETTPGVTGFMNKTIEYINNNIFESIDIEKICSAVHMSKYHLCREFKKNTGVTIMKYILKTRITLAKNMLLKDNLSVTEISNRCGFSSVSYFSRAFKEEAGITPLNFRRKGSCN